MSVNKIIAIFGIILVIFIGVILYQFNAKPSKSKSAQNTTPAPTATATIKNHTFKIILAKTQQEQQKGLSGRDSLPDDQGMLFLFDKPGYYSFWMKDMKFPIDILFIQDNKVAYIVHDAPTPPPGVNTPPIFQPTVPINKVLEIKAGFAKKYTIKEGDKVEIKL